TEFVRATRADVLKKCRDRGNGVILSRGCRNSTVASCANNLAGLLVLREAISVVLCVPAVAQHDEWHPRVTERALGVLMLTGERVTRVLGVQDSCVHHAGDTSRLR